MKKLVIIIALAGFASCNSGNVEATAPAADSTKVSAVCDSSAVCADSTKCDTIK